MAKSAIDRHITSLKISLEVTTVAIPRLLLRCSWNAARKPLRNGKGTNWSALRLH